MVSDCHGAICNTVSDRQGSRRDTFFGYIHKRLPNGARIGRLVFPEQALVHQCLDNPIRHLGAGQDEAAAFALTASALTARGGGGGGVGHSRHLFFRQRKRVVDELAVEAQREMA